jgi:osmotically-inducible protein OsmY
MMYATHSLFRKFSKISAMSGHWRVIMLVGLSFTLAIPMLAQPIPGADEAISDEAISQAVLRKIRAHEAISAHLIDVTTHDGIVTLSGAVSHLPAKNLAASIAINMIGVRAVVNKLIVHPLPRTDDILHSDIRQSLKTDPAIDASDLEVAVTDGVVTLSGTVASEVEHQLVVQVARGVKGIKEINDNLVRQYDQQWSDAEIQQEIQRRFRLLVTIMPENINVIVKDGHVTLNGVVGSLAEKTTLENVAWVNGVQSVDASSIGIDWWADRRTRNRLPGLRPDIRIQNSVEDALLYDPRVSAFDIEIEVKNQIVTLSGIVDNLKARRAAEQNARNTLGVRTVKNTILVRPKIRLADDELARQVSDALSRDPVMERYDLQVTARNHKIYLLGTVDSYYEKWWAEDVVSRVNGVADIQNSLAVNYDWAWKADSDIEEDVEQELFWDLTVDSDAITVDAQDGNVILTGKVDNWQELEKAVQNAFEGGAKSVQSRLQLRDDPDEYPLQFQYRYYW